MKSDYHSFLSEILMYTKPTVIVEGKNDVNLIKTLFSKNNPQSNRIIVISPEIRGLKNQKGIVINAIKDINLNSYKKRIKYIGIVDSDFNQICGTCHCIPNLFYTDTHDFDTLIFSSNAFNKFIQFMYLNPNDINTEKVRNKCVELASEFGYYILSLYEKEFHELIKELRPIDQYIDTNLDLLHKEINKKLSLFEKIKKISNSDYLAIKKNYENRKKQSLDLYNITNGHDLNRILLIMTLNESYKLKKKGFSTYIAKKPLDDIEKENLIHEIENGLRIAYEFNYFIDTQLYKMIKNHQNKVKIDFIE